jgi:hypothetical protein
VYFFTDDSEEHIASISIGGFLPGLLFHPEDVGDAFPLIICGFISKYAALQPEDRSRHTCV